MADKRFVFGVDLDGVCADFYGGLRPIAAEWLDVGVETLTEAPTYGLPEWGIDRAPGGYSALHRFAVTQRQLFEQLKPMRGAPDVLRRLSEKDIRIRIITHRLFIKYFHETAARQTIRWLDHWDIPIGIFASSPTRRQSAQTSTSKTPRATSSASEPMATKPSSSRTLPTAR